MVRTNARACPCWSTLTVPLSLISAPRLALNAYRAPVHPGPEAGPVTVTRPAFVISASICSSRRSGVKRLIGKGWPGADAGPTADVGALPAPSEAPPHACPDCLRHMEYAKIGRAH